MNPLTIYNGTISINHINPTKEIAKSEINNLIKSCPNLKYNPFTRVVKSVTVSFENPDTIPHALKYASCFSRGFPLDFFNNKEPNSVINLTVAGHPVSLIYKEVLSALAITNTSSDSEMKPQSYSIGSRLSMFDPSNNNEIVSIAKRAYSEPTLKPKVDFPTQEASSTSSASGSRSSLYPCTSNAFIPLEGISEGDEEEEEEEEGKENSIN